MPIMIPNSLPARKILESENVFVMTEDRAVCQDIRPLKIAIVNLMPTKIETETQLLRLLGNSPLQIEIELIQTATHASKNTSQTHLATFYKTIDDIRGQKFDGMIITGAPVETMQFEEVDYWEELTEIMDWARDNVYSTLYICWGAQAGLYYHFGIKKRALDKKLSGVYRHDVLEPLHPLMRGFDDRFFSPHSRYTYVRDTDIDAVPELVTLAKSKRAGVAIVAHKNGRMFFCTGHLEYDRMTLANEYFRDVAKGIEPQIPYNYFPDDDPEQTPFQNWRSYAHMFFANWLNYYVYQQTPYDLNDLIGRKDEE